MFTSIQYIQVFSSTEFDYYMAYKEENIIEILNTLELDGYIRIPRNAKKAEQMKKALEEERNLDHSDHLGWFYNEFLGHHLFSLNFDDLIYGLGFDIKTSKVFGNFFAGHISEQFEKTISQIDPEITKKELKIRETYRKRRSASGKVRRQILPKLTRSPIEGVVIEEIHLPCDMSPEYTNFTFFETFESSFKNLLELSLDQLEINGKYNTCKNMCIKKMARIYRYIQNKCFNYSRSSKLYTKVSQSNALTK